MVLDPFIKSTLGELMFSNIAQAAQMAEMQKALTTTAAENEALKAQIAELKPAEKTGAKK
jgi:cell division protein FtsB